jgi:Protein of unknown function (DUF1638)
MKIKAFTCNALARPAYWCASQSPHIVDIELFQFGLHSQPENLRSLLQEKIYAANNYDAITLVYGLCGQATAGLTAGNIPLVIPRCHDCITLFLGSRERYNDQFNNYPGTYWYSQDYVERAESGNMVLAIGSGVDGGSGIQGTYEEYVQKYGVENAEYLMEVMGAWQQHYKRAVYLDMGIGDSSSIAAIAQAEAVCRGWAFERLMGDLGLIQHLLWGEWDAKYYLVLQPGQVIRMTYSEDIISC